MNFISHKSGCLCHEVFFLSLWQELFSVQDYWGHFHRESLLWFMHFDLYFYIFATMAKV